MIGRDEPMALVITKDREVKTICYLGHATLDGNEYDRIRNLAEENGCYAYITTVEEDFPTFESLYQAVKQATK